MDVAVRFEGFDLPTKNALELFLFENNIETRPMFPSDRPDAHLSRFKGERMLSPTS